ncbi:MAG TPA: ABC transporter permease, partial [Candidatus Eisenbacteria bacterium]|nr:ABC transporter permease [Candidatus Eisenbacteria bacterium]
MTRPAGMRRAVMAGAQQAAALGAFLAAWELLVRLLAMPKPLVPAPTVIAAELWQIRGLIAGSAAYTMSTALAGYGLAVAIGVTLAIV